MAIPFEPMTTEKLKEFLREYLEENSRSPDCSGKSQQESHKKRRDKLRALNQTLESWSMRQFHS